MYKVQLKLTDGAFFPSHTFTAEGAFQTWDEVLAWKKREVLRHVPLWAPNTIWYNLESTQ